MKQFVRLTKLIQQLSNDPHGEWIIDRDNDGSKEHPIQWPHVDYTKTVMELEHAIYDFVDQNPDYKLTSYSDILEARGIKWSTASMEKADVSSLDPQGVMALLVGAIRAERFCDGAFLGFLKSGAVLKWLSRLKEIDDQA